MDKLAKSASSAAPSQEDSTSDEDNWENTLNEPDDADSVGDLDALRADLRTPALPLHHNRADQSATKVVPLPPNPHQYEHLDVPDFLKTTYIAPRDKVVSGVDRW